VWYRLDHSDDQTQIGQAIVRDPVGPRADFLFRRPTSLSRKGKLAPGKIQRTYAELQAALKREVEKIRTTSRSELRRQALNRLTYP
jgi:hypothetical protein